MTPPPLAKVTNRKYQPEFVPPRARRRSVDVDNFDKVGVKEGREEGKEEGGEEGPLEGVARGRKVSQRHELGGRRGTRRTCVHYHLNLCTPLSSLFLFSP